MAAGNRGRRFLAFSAGDNGGKEVCAGREERVLRAGAGSAPAPCPSHQLTSPQPTNPGYLHRRADYPEPSHLPLWGHCASKGQPSAQQCWEVKGRTKALQHKAAMCSWSRHVSQASLSWRCHPATPAHGGSFPGGEGTALRPPNPFCCAPFRAPPSRGTHQHRVRVTAITCMSLLMGAVTLLLSREPGQFLALSGCTGEPRAQSAHARGHGRCQTFVPRLPSGFASRSSSLW